MKGIAALLVIGSAGLILSSGCGGSHTNDRLPNFYAGGWSGTWSSTVANDGGAITMTIDSYGNITGTEGRNGGLSGTLGGVVTGTGSFSSTVAYPSSGNFVMNGQMSLNTAGTLSGTFTYWWNGTQYTGTFTQTSKSTTSTAGSTSGSTG